MEKNFDENYYERGLEMGISGYSNYRWMPELTIPMCFEMIEILDIKKQQTILDFGCAKGYVVKAFRLLNRKAYGADISDYAIKNCPVEIKKYLHKICPYEKIPIVKSKVYDWIIAKDVLEHINYEHIDGVLKTLREAGNGLFVIVPLGDSKKYVIPAYEVDKTHVIRENMEWWKEKFVNDGYKIVKSKYKMGNLKYNWSTWKRGNGFFILK